MVNKSLDRPRSGLSRVLGRVWGDLAAAASRGCPRAEITRGVADGSIQRPKCSQELRVGREHCRLVNSDGRIGGGERRLVN